MNSDFQPCPDQACIHNLPGVQHSRLIGREVSLERLHHLISENHGERIIKIIGIGGVGKTALALDVAHYYVFQKEKFGMILFASAQSETLLPSENPVIDRSRPIRTLKDLCNDIAFICEKRGLILINPHDQDEQLKDFLSTYNQRILLVLDNLESLETEERFRIMEFIKDIRSPRLKTIITTRTSDDPDIIVPQLGEKATIELVEALLRINQLYASESFKERIMKLSGGIPLAIHYAVGILAIELNEETAIQKLLDPKGDLTLYCFDKLVTELEQKNPLAYKLLLAASLSSNGLTIGALIEIADLRNSSDKNAAQISLDLLIRCSLVYPEKKLYRLLPLTRRYILSRLDDKKFDSIRKNWVSHYIHFCEANGGEDQGEWHFKFDLIDKEWKNIKEVFEWCQSRQDFQSCKILWKSLLRFTYLHGYWTDRLAWTQWLIDVSIRNKDSEVFAEATTAKAWIILLRESKQDLLHAENLLKEAWNFRDSCTPFIACTIAINLGVLYTRLPNYNKADRWFRISYNIRRENIASFKGADKTRLELRYILYYAELFYRRYLDGQGKTFDLIRADKMYRITDRKADGINWLRFRVKAIERRIHLLLVDKDSQALRIDENLREAESLLNRWYPVMEHNNDQRRLAFYKRDFAILFYKKRMFLEAKKWACEAKLIFKSLEMRKRAEDMSDLVNRCINQLSMSGN